MTENTFDANYPRDLIGYGANPPKVSWPQSAKLAVQFVINYEEGAENCVLHGDAQSETFLSEIIGAKAYPDRHMSMESIYEYGSRAGFWRLHRLFNKYQIPATVYGVGMALLRNSDAVEAMQKSNWEIASHAYRWVDHQFMSEDQEREQIKLAIDAHTQATGEPPLGWYTGRDSPNTRKLICQQGGFLYDSDSYADDLPYWNTEHGKPHLVIPYTLDTNDMRFAAPQGFNCGDQFYTYLKDSFDALYAEGDTHPKMMNIGLHCRIIGRPGRIQSLERFIKYVTSHQDVWVCKRIDIAKHWHKFHKPE
ncbi:allantoinase PuuE [Paraglaciecola aquimarina]|uniref:Allantoinase PuuE n=1 Tax=Paraglaciecola algarum TaxID=3050085 RepID=A0ABS9D714_9ALTE|nr:allantoinase PuuE [Paraglaciecola sp. G1-23]MCF2948704.1 allantoinase PuuE [Paraglaciecola sp. G1-23]